MNKELKEIKEVFENAYQLLDFDEFCQAILKWHSKNTLTLESKIEQLTKERDELKCYVNTVEKPSVERCDELEQQLQAEQEKNKELRKGIKATVNKWNLGDADGVLRKLLKQEP